MEVLNSCSCKSKQFQHGSDVERTHILDECLSVYCHNVYAINQNIIHKQWLSFPFSTRLHAYLVR